MNWTSVIAARLRALFTRDRRQADDEVRFHLDMQIDDNVKYGSR